MGHLASDYGGCLFPESEVSAANDVIENCQQSLDPDIKQQYKESVKGLVE